MAKTSDGGLLEFVPRVSPRFMPPHHLPQLVEFFERIDRGEEVRGAISVPRRHGKTELLLHGAAWLLARHPGMTIGYAGYSADFAHSKSKRCRDLALRAGVELRGASAAAGEWRTLEGGGMLAGGIGGAWTGHGVDVLLVDDPHKNRSEAESPARRRAVEDWWRSSAITSVEPGGSALAVHTRWHLKDLIGLLKKDKDVEWEHVNLPAINDGSDPRREVGEALWPERWPLAALERRRAEAGPFEWASLYQGYPRPRGSNIFGSPSFYRELPKTRYRVAYGVDLAYSAKTQSDRSVLFEMMRHDPPKTSAKDRPLPMYYVRSVVSVQVEQPMFARKLKAVRAQHRWPMLFIGGNEKGVADFIAKEVNDFHYEYTSVNKLTRAQHLHAAWADGRVLWPDTEAFPDAHRWLTDTLDVFDAFTGNNDTRDDEVDAAVAAFKQLDKPSGGPLSAYA